MRTAISSNKYTSGACSGFSLIETLVALLVLSVGILGTTTMQTLSFRANVDAYYRTQASYITSDMIGRMRANPDGVTSNRYDDLDTADLPADPGCINTGCTSLQMSQHDLWEWAQYFTDVYGIGNSYQPVLRDGRATLSRDGNDFTIQVTWNETYNQGTQSGSSSISFRM